MSLRFGHASLQREYCPRCKDQAVFKFGKCCRRGCGYRLKIVQNLEQWRTPAISAAEWRRKNHADVMRRRRAEARKGQE